MGKGSRQRPSRVPDRKVDENWERTFRSEMGDFHVSFGSMVYEVPRDTHIDWADQQDIADLDKLEGGVTPDE